MSPIAIGILAVSMSVDAFIAALGKGAGLQRPNLWTALRIGAVFGLVEMLTPLIGWALGLAAAAYIDAVDHWIAFGLLAAVGLNMLRQALGTQGTEAAVGMTLWALLMTAVGTSIDAMAVGVSLAFLEVNIILVAAAIGLATMVMSAGGILAGHVLGARFGRVAEGLGGLALIALGATILHEHLVA